MVKMGTNVRLKAVKRARNYDRRLKRSKAGKAVAVQYAGAYLTRDWLSSVHVIISVLNFL